MKGLDLLLLFFLCKNFWKQSRKQSRSYIYWLDRLSSQNWSEIRHKGFSQSYIHYLNLPQVEDKSNYTILYRFLSISRKLASPFTMFWCGEVLREFCVCYALPMEALGREFLEVGEEGGSVFKLTDRKIKQYVSSQFFDQVIYLCMNYFKAI